METSELRARLEELQAALSDATGVDEETERALRTLLEDIEPLLVPADRGESTLVDRLNKAAAHFEAEHPALASLIARVTDSLAQAGI
jgi:hypothetical protein